MTPPVNPTNINRITLAPPPAPNAPAAATNQQLDDLIAQTWAYLNATMVDKETGRPLAEIDGKEDIDGDKNKRERYTYSETVGYVMLEAVAVGDEKRLERTWQWAKTNLQRNGNLKVFDWQAQQWKTSAANDNLFAWRALPITAKKESGWVILDSTSQRNGLDAAPDADEDIAAALVFAYKRWGKQEYLDAALPIIYSIWDKYVKEINGEPIIFAGEKFKQVNETNPSYFRPYFYEKVFSDDEVVNALNNNAQKPNWKANWKTRWSDLARSSRRIMRDAGDAKLRGYNGVKLYDGTKNLLPDWISLDNKGQIVDGRWHRDRGGQQSGWEVSRGYLHAAQDYRWTGNQAAEKYLKDNTCSSADFGPHCFYRKELIEEGAIQGGYNHDGSEIDPLNPRIREARNLDREQYSLYGALLPYFYFGGDQDAAQKVLDRILKYYKKEGYYQYPRDYYGSHLVLQGLIAVRGLLKIQGKNEQLPVLPGPKIKITFGSNVINPFSRSDESPDDLAQQNEGAIDFFHDLASGPNGLGIINRVATVRAKIGVRPSDNVKAARAADTVFTGFFNAWLKQSELGYVSTVPRSKVIEYAPEIKDRLGDFFKNPKDSELEFKPDIRGKIAGEVKNLKQRRALLDMLGQTNEDIEKALSFIGAAAPQYKAQFAFILASNPLKYEKYLRLIGKSMQADVSSAFAGAFQKYQSHKNQKELRFQLYQVVSKYYEDKSKPTLYHAPDPRFEGEMLLQLGINSTNKKNALRYYDRAIKKFDLVLANQITDDAKLKNSLELKGKTYRNLIESQHPYDTDEMYGFSQGLSYALKAQAILLRAGEETDPQKITHELGEAFGLITRAANFMDIAGNHSISGLFFLQLKQFAAESLLRHAFTLKDLAMKNTSFAIAGAKNQDFKTLIGYANGLLEDILTWNENFHTSVLSQNRTVVLDKDAPVWLRQIKAFAAVWRSKSEMFESGEMREGKRRDYSFSQLKMLKTAEVRLLEVLRENEAYKKSHNGAEIIDLETVADIRATLAQNRTRQAYISMDFKAEKTISVTHAGEKVELIGYRILLTKAQEEIDKVLEPQSRAKPEILAEAHVWAAKIRLAEADKILNRQKREEVLAGAQREISQAFGIEDGKPYLRGASLSAGLQTLGDALAAQKKFKDAEAVYRLALGEKADAPAACSFLQPLLPVLDEQMKTDLKKIFEKNYFARAALGDILNWQGRYEEALKEYDPQKIPANAITAKQAQLGTIECKMRLNESYTPKQIADLEKKVTEIVDAEPLASSLTLRSIGSLFEAYRTDEDLQEKIIYIGNRLLGLSTATDLPEAEQLRLRAMFIPLSNERNGMEDRAKTEIYLRVGEVLLWQQRFEEALSFVDIDNYKKLEDKPELKTALKDVLANKADLRVLRGLIEAEARMRNSRAAGPFLDFAEAEKPLQVALEEKDPDLAARIVGDKIEAYMLEKSWQKAIEAATPKNWGVLKEQFNAMFESRTLGYQKTMFELNFKLVEALIGAKDFNRAVKEIIRKGDTTEAGDELGIISKTEEMRVKYPHLFSLADRFLAQANIYLGKAYSYRWSEQDFEKSNDSYKNSLDLVKNDLSKAGRLLLAETHLGLGEIHRFGQSIKNGHNDYEASKTNYRLALQILAGSIQPSSLGAGVWGTLVDAKYIDNDGIVQPKSENGGESLGLDLSLNAPERSRVIGLIRQSRTVPRKSIKRRELITDVYHGFSLLEQAETHPVPAYQYLLNARYYMGQILVPPDETKAAVPRTSNTILTPNFTASYEHFGFGVGSNGYGSSGTENRFSVTGQLPVYKEQLIFSFTNNTDTRKDRFGESRTNASRIGIYYRPEWLDKLVTVGIDAKAPGMNRELFQTARSLPVNFQNPNMIFSGSVATKWLTAFGAYNWNWENPLLTSHYEKLMWNLASYHISWLQAQVGFEGGQYNFTVLGTPRERANIGLVLNWDYDLAEVKPLGEGAELRHGTFKVGGTLGIGLWQREFIPGATCEEKAHNPGLTEAQTVNRSIFNMFNSSSSCSAAKDPYYNKYSTNGPAWGSIPLYLMGRVEYNAGRIGVVQLYGGLNYQQTPEFTYQDWRAGVNFNLAQFLGL
ncbi:MAG: glycosyl hydrolase family 8 [Candidatus Margulisiibacteriota bacterium]